MQMHNISSQEFENELHNRIQLGHKMDKYFYNSIISVKRLYGGITLFRILKPIVYIILIFVINYLGNKQNKFWIFMYVELGFFILLMIQSFVFIMKNYSDSRQNNLFFVELSKMMGHAVLNQQITSDNHFQSLQKCVSQTKQNVIQNNDDSSCCGSINTKAEIVMRVYARSLLQLILIGVLEMIDVFLIWGGITYLIVKGAKDGFQEFNQVQINCFILILAINPLNVLMFVCLCISLSVGASTSPFIGIGFLCYHLYHKTVALYFRHQQIKKRMKVRRMKINPNQKQQQQQSCSICLALFKNGQDVGELQCQTKHIFHLNCIQEWMNKTNTCPLCRCQIYDKIYKEEALR